MVVSPGARCSITASSRASASSATTSCPCAARSAATRPVPAPRSRIGPSRGVRELAPQRTGRRRRSRSPRRARSTEAFVIPTTASRGRAPRGGRGARAAPCRWAARRRASSGGVRHRGVERAAEVAVHLELGVDPRVLQPQRHLLGARAAAGDAPHAAREHLEVGVPDPGDVAAVGDPVVERDPQVELPVLERERAQHLVRAGRVLDQQDRDLAAVHGDRLHAPERAAEALQRLADGLERHAELAAPWPPRLRRCRRCRGRAAAARARGRPGACAARRASRSCRRASRSWPQPAAPAACGRSSGTGSGPCGRGRWPRTRTRGRSCGSASSRRRAACPGSACESSSTPK